MEKIFVAPIKKFNKTLFAPPDKSITHRAVMFNAFADGKAQIKNGLMGLDCRSTIDCMRRLGAGIEVKGNDITVYGTGGAFNDADLFVGNSGTTIRLLMGFLASKEGGNFRLDGDESIRRRPMRRVTEPLEKMGAQIAVTAGGTAPISVTGKKLKGIFYRMPVASAQVKSAVILAALGAEGETKITEPTVSRNHTEVMLKAMGADIAFGNGEITVKKSKLKSLDLSVPGDISAAAYPLVLAAGLKGGAAVIKDVGVNPTRTGIIDVMKSSGADISYGNIVNSGEMRADITIRYSRLTPFAVGGEIIPRLIDEIPALAVLACFIDGVSVIKDASELKVKESNRIDTTVNMLKKMGADIESTDDGMIIRGKGGLIGGAEIDPQGDHRIAMCAAVAGALSKNGVTVLNPDCADVSYPDFYRIFD